MPCTVDPVRFDCGECVIGPFAPCRFRTDETLRHERAARRREDLALLSPAHGQVVEILSNVRTLLASRMLALPSTVVLDSLPPETASGVVPAQLETLLRQTADVRETSPGMFKLDLGALPLDSRGLQSDDLSTGA